MYVCVYVRVCVGLATRGARYAGMRLVGAMCGMRCFGCDVWEAMCGMLGVEVEPVGCEMSDAMCKIRSV